jgi:hypothetical protein
MGEVEEEKLTFLLSLLEITSKDKGQTSRKLSASYKT